MESIVQAGKEEKALALEAGDVCDDGTTAHIKVIVDGGWSHRSHGHRYSANSGVAVIIGARTKKILHLGVRNKFCSYCEFYKSRATEIHPHKCYKNWDKASTAMEADIIVQGFQVSEEVHGLQYRILVGDGDSSVYHQVMTQVQYGYLVQKSECANHVVRNYTSRLYKLRGENSGNQKLLTIPRLKRISMVLGRQYPTMHSCLQTSVAHTRRGQLSDTNSADSCSPTL